MVRNLWLRLRISREEITAIKGQLEKIQEKGISSEMVNRVSEGRPFRDVNDFLRCLFGLDRLKVGAPALKGE